MKKSLLTLLLALASLAVAASEPIVIKIWPDGAPNLADEGWFTPEQMAEKNLVADPVLLLYPAAEPNGLAVVACPGGGYGYLAKYHEGIDMADWFNNQGITYGVLLYRMPQGHDDVPLSDVHQAIRILRKDAARYGITKVGIMGSSAGGHLASTAATHYLRPTRPDFQILFYPVVSLDNSISHGGTCHGLLGDNPSRTLIDLYSNELHVTPDTPPAFIVHSSDDNVVPVENSVRYYRALTNAGVMSQLLTLPSGGHGWGFNDDFIYKPVWTTALAAWLAQLPR